MYEFFNIKKGDIVTITGAGGKTSLMFSLAFELSKLGSVLVTTTTKIYKPKFNLFEKLFIKDEIISGTAKNIFVMGEEIIDGKLTSLSYEKISLLKDFYDFILIEADGAKEKLLKEWNPTEPCIPKFSSKTIGIINMDIIGKKLIENNVHRFEIFKEKFPNFVSSNISTEFLNDYISKANFFKDSYGDNYLFFNGIDGDNYLDKFSLATSVANQLKTSFYSPKILMGSIKENNIFVFKAVEAIVMASGFSKRMGQNKLKMPYRDVSLLEYTFEKLSYLPFFNVIVCGREEWTKDLANKYNFTYLENEVAHLGQSESIKLGVKNSKGDGLVFFTGDQPLLTINTILKLYYTFEKYNYITIPISEGNRYSPVFFPKNKKNDLLNLKGDTGGREVIKNTPLLSFVEFPSKEEFSDIDTPEEYEYINKLS